MVCIVYVQIELRQSSADSVRITVGQAGFDPTKTNEQLLVCESAGVAPNACADKGLTLPASEPTVYSNACFKSADLLDTHVHQYLRHMQVGLVKKSIEKMCVFFFFFFFVFKMFTPPFGFR